MLSINEINFFVEMRMFKYSLHLVNLGEFDSLIISYFLFVLYTHVWQFYFFPNVIKNYHSYILYLC